jgi:hypothetical protein
VFAGAAAAEGDEAEADCAKMSDLGLDGSPAGVVCQSGRVCESPPPAPFRRPPAAAAATGAAALGISGGVAAAAAAAGNCSPRDETNYIHAEVIGMTTATCHQHG